MHRDPLVVALIPLGCGEAGMYTSRAKCCAKVMLLLDRNEEMETLFIGMPKEVCESITRGLKEMRRKPQVSSGRDFRQKSKYSLEVYSWDVKRPWFRV